MRQPASVRILVVRSPSGTLAGPASAVLALERLGAEVAIEAVDSVERALAQAHESETDLVVAEPGAPAAELLRLLGALRAEGPPVIVVTAPGEEERALEWFRAGASDCVAAASAEEALPVAALDLIRRQRAARQQQLAERRIASLRRYTRNIIQNINSALLVVDGSCRVTWANGAAEELLGEPPGGVVGRVATEWFEGQLAAEGPLLRSLEKGERFRGVEVGICRSNGERVPAAIFCGPLRDDEGRDLGAVAILQDLSETRRLQRQLFHSEKMASIGQLAAGVAHEINNPVGFIDANLFQMEEYVADLRRLWARVRSLARVAEQGDARAVRSELDALRRESQELDAEFVLEDLGKAIRESREGSERIRHIVQDLRAFARPDGSERVWADLNQCLDSTANIVWSMMKHAVRLEKDYGELPALHCHPGQLKQVFMNLLMNAYQAVVARVGETGELGTIEIATALELARGPDGAAREAVAVTVRDDGVGIAASHLDRIFDPFFTTKEVGVGTGLGLSTAFHLVSSHGGRIEAESREGEGSTFRVILPVTRPLRGGP